MALGFSPYVVLNGYNTGETVLFKPTGKYSTVRLNANNASWANGSPDIGPAATHDASAGAVPTFTTARRGQMCVATVAGTIGGRTVLAGDLLIANRNNPTAAGHWDIVTDCTAEFEAAVVAAEGAPLFMPGTYLLDTADSARMPMNIEGEPTIFNRLGKPAIWTRDNDYITDGTDDRTVPTSTSTLSTTSLSIGDTVNLTITNPQNYDFAIGDCAYWRSTSTRTVFVEITGWNQSTGVLTGEVIWFIGTGSGTSWTIYAGGQAGKLIVPVSSLGKGRATDSVLGSSIADVAYMNLANADNASRFHVGQKVVILSNKTHISSATDYLTNVGTVTAVDTSNNRLYLDRVPKYWNIMAEATNIYVAVLNMDTPVNINGGVFMGAPTIVGGEVGWYRNLYGSNPISVTVSGSGDTRTLTYSGDMPEWLVNQCVVIQSTYNWPCKITAVDTGAKTLTVTVPKSGSNYVDEKGDIHSVPTSGSVDTVPGFWCDEFDNTSHGGMIVAQNAHGSTVEFDVVAPWGAMFRRRFSHFCKNKKIRVLKCAHVGTGIATRSWRLAYVDEKYASGMGDSNVEGEWTRHDSTGGGSGTSSTWEPYFYINKIGTAAENRVKTKAVNSLGGSADTHTLQPGTVFDSEVYHPTGMDSAHTYSYGISSQSRAEDCTYNVRSVGGFIGHRIANGSSYVREAGNWEKVNIVSSEKPLHDSGHAFSGGSSTYLGTAFMFQSQTAYTHKTLAEGRIESTDDPSAFILEEDTNADMSEVIHNRVGYCIGWIKDGATLKTDMLNAGYSIPGGAVTTSSSSVTLGTGSKSFTLPTGLTIRTGQKVLVQDAAAPRTNYAWGRVESYDSGTGAASFEFAGYEGSGTLSDWVVVIGAKAPRFGVAFSGTGTLHAGIVTVNLGVGANPDEIFHSADNTSGKIVNVNTLSIIDPHGVGMPNIVTAGREADFTVNIGTILYNGERVSVSGISHREIMRVSIHSVLNSGGGWTSMPLAETFLAGSTRHIRRVDLTGYSQVRIVGNTQTAGVAGAKIYPKFRSTYDATVGNWTNLSSGSCEFIITNTGPYESGWVDLYSNDMSDVYICLAGSGGDGATTPSIGNLALEFR